MSNVLPLPDGRFVTIRKGESDAQAWARAQKSYPEAFGIKQQSVILPDGSQYPISKGKSPAEAFADARKVHPEAFGIKQQAAMAQYLPLPDGNSITIREGESDAQAWARAQRDYPASFGITPTDTRQREVPKEVATPEGGFVAAVKSGMHGMTGGTALTLERVDGERALMDAGIATVCGLIAAVCLHRLLTTQIWNKPRTTAHHTGLWSGSLLASNAFMVGIGKLVNTALHAKLTPDDWLRYGFVWSVVMPVAFFVVGYAAGWAFRRLRPHPKSAPTPVAPVQKYTTAQASAPRSAAPSKDAPATTSDLSSLDDEALYAMVMSEISSGKRPGLWAMALEQTAQGGSTEGAYIALRVRQLKAERQSESLALQAARLSELRAMKGAIDSGEEAASCLKDGRFTEEIILGNRCLQLPHGQWVLCTKTTFRIYKDKSSLLESIEHLRAGRHPSVTGLVRTIELAEITDD